MPANLGAVSDSDIMNELRKRQGSVDDKKRLVILGPPASGKTTQAEQFAQKMGVCRLSVGDMLRQSAATGSLVGQWIKSMTDKGDLVPDDLVLGLIQEGIKKPECSGGFVLDGYPRTLQQAIKLDKHLKNEYGLKGLDSAVLMRVEENQTLREQVLWERVKNRMIHLPSGRVYHSSYLPPKVAGKDDVTGEALVMRSDDSLLALGNRLQAYQKETLPALSYYRYNGLLQEVDSTNEPHVVFQGLCSAYAAQLVKNEKAASAPDAVARQPRTVAQARSAIHQQMSRRS
jgi:adenylate kinase